MFYPFLSNSLESPSWTPLLGWLTLSHPPNHRLESALSSYHILWKLSLTLLRAWHKTGDLKFLVERGLGWRGVLWRWRIHSPFAFILLPLILMSTHLPNLPLCVKNFWLFSYPLAGSDDPGNLLESSAMFPTPFLMRCFCQHIDSSSSPRWRTQDLWSLTTVLLVPWDLFRFWR